MMPEEAVDLLGQLLSDAGFDSGQPQLATFWRGFKDWACQPVDCRSDKVFISIGYDARNTFAHVELCRDFEHDCEGLDFDVTARFYSSRPDAPQLAEAGLRSECQLGRLKSLTDIESWPAFLVAVAYLHWQFEAYRE